MIVLQLENLKKKKKKDLISLEFEISVFSAFRLFDSLEKKINCSGCACVRFGRGLSRAHGFMVRMKTGRLIQTNKQTLYYF